MRTTEAALLVLLVWMQPGVDNSISVSDVEIELSTRKAHILLAVEILFPLTRHVALV